MILNRNHFARFQTRPVDQDSFAKMFRLTSVFVFSIIALILGSIIVWVVLLLTGAVNVSYSYNYQVGNGGYSQTETYEVN